MTWKGLVIEDIEEQRKLLVEALRPLVTDIAEASTLDEAKAKVLAVWPDLIILDAVFPESNYLPQARFNAEHFLEALRSASKEHMELPPDVILVTGNPESYAPEKAELIRQWREEGRVKKIHLKGTDKAGWGLFQTLLQCDAKELLQYRDFAPLDERL